MLKIEGDTTPALNEFLAIELPDDVEYAWVSITGHSFLMRTYDVIGWASEAESENDDGRRAICRIEVAAFNKGTSFVSRRSRASVRF